MSNIFLREWFNFLRAADGFSVPINRLFCAGQSFFLRGSGYPAHGICGRQHEQRKNKGWQDRLSPALGAKCSALALGKHGRGRRVIGLLESFA